MTSQGIDANGPFRFVASVIVLTIAAPLVLRPVVDLLKRADTRAWARNGFMAATVTALFIATLDANVLWTAVPAAVAMLVCVVLRRLDARFSRRDAILVPSIASLCLAIADWNLPLREGIVVATAIVFAIRIAIVLIPRSPVVPPSHCFAIAPLGLILQSNLLARDQRYVGLPAIAIVVITPFVLRLFTPATIRARRILRIAIVSLVYPLAMFG